MRARKSSRTLWLLAVAWLALGAQAGEQPKEKKAQAVKKAAAAQKQRPLPPGFKAERDIEYVAGGGNSRSLDIYYPEKAEGKLPLIVWVHGGAWMGGDKKSCPALRMLERGYVVASINYRLSQEAIWPAQIQDCKAAIRWLRANADKYHIDPDRIGVWGSSAGGHLVALLGTTGDVKALEGNEGPQGVSSRVQAVCDFFGPTDFTKIGNFPSNLNHNAPDSPESKLLGVPILEHPEKCAEANPITYITKDDPPMLIMHGDKDMTVPINQSELLYEAMKKAGLDVTYHVVAGGGHGFGGPEIDRMVNEFFDRVLKASK
ncbi:MAG: alpha/beta hydrolase [Candidatus Sumerlaeia bacterium]|nr:alpha/beta hydrolase [Candidatus Sumerlaeia bacterium]